MKIFKNVLSDKLYTELKLNLRSILHKEVWSVSLLAWDKNVHVGLKGSCVTSSLEKNLHKKLEKEVKNFLPPYKKMTSQYNLWNHLSGVSKHNDSKSSFGATLYLNESWELNYGGLFVWIEDDKNDIHNVICPQKNMMILNDNYEYHMVTPVNFDIPEPRCSIQIWGYNQ